MTKKQKQQARNLNAEGYTIAEIAENVGISESDVIEALK